MRTKQEYKSLLVNQEIYDRIQKDKNHFEKKIGGGKWSVSDVLTEYLKIIDFSLEQSKKNKRS